MAIDKNRFVKYATTTAVGNNDSLNYASSTIKYIMCACACQLTHGIWGGKRLGGERAEINR